MRVSTSAELGSIIRVARKKNGITQTDFALLMGISHVTLRRIEQGHPGVNLGLVFQVMDELGVHLEAEVPDTENPSEEGWG